MNRGMLLFIVLIAFGVAAVLAFWCGVTMTRSLYGHASASTSVGAAGVRLDEHRFFPDDVKELDAAFNRVVRSYFARD